MQLERHFCKHASQPFKNSIVGLNFYCNSNTDIYLEALPEFSDKPMIAKYNP